MHNKILLIFNSFRCHALPYLLPSIFIEYLLISWDSKLYQIELLCFIPRRWMLFAVSKNEFILKDIDCRILIEISEVNLFQVFMFRIIVMCLREFFHRIEHNLCAKSLGESKDA
jgi:hypothetical protein